MIGFPGSLLTELAPEVEAALRDLLPPLFDRVVTDVMDVARQVREAANSPGEAADGGSAIGAADARAARRMPHD